MARPSIFLLLGAAVVLGGCSSTSLALFGVDAATQLATGRSIQGNVIHAVTGKDCAPVNWIVGRPICQEEKQVAEASQPPAYCYRTLGQVACHSERDPWMSPERRLFKE
jgi:hypothetical protein